ncbi:MAG: molybdopterin oxidoreductase [Sulfurovum sp.]|nr:MAG: molybdopterin oxidoreductase [Sulfurovum sp.]
MQTKTACALDCYDACAIVVEKGKVKADTSNPIGNGALCALVNKYMDETPRITTPRIEGKEVSLDEAMKAVHDAFMKKTSLLWRGSGNMGVMQEVSNLFIERINGTLTYGSLCDGAGEAGILEGRGVNRNLPLEQIQKADTVVIWGRNITVTNAHMMPYLEGKNIVVIDPVKTAIAKKADFYLQIQPRTDYYLAIMLARFIYMEDSQDIEWLEENASEYEAFYEFTQEHRIKAILSYIGTDLGEMGQILHFLRHQKVVFLVGAGVQKYTTGSYTLQAIDALASLLGLFGKEGCGVHYLSTSKLGFDNPFEVGCKKISKPLASFSDFDTVLIQGGNPAASMPNSVGVTKELEAVDTLIYFGLYENETSKRAKIVIPAKHFFEKEDVLLSYGHQYVRKMHKVRESDIGISEYDFTKNLFDAFGLEGLEEESYYIDAWIKQCKQENDILLSPAHQDIPYADGFGIEGGDEFVFIEEYEDDFINTKQFTKVRTSKKNKEEDKRFWLLSPKSPKSLNTQYRRDNKVYLHPDIGYKEGENIKLISEYGSIQLEVKLNEDIRRNCIVVPSNTIGINNLTPPISSQEGESACYQEVKVEIQK